MSRLACTAQHSTAWCSTLAEHRVAVLVLARLSDEPQRPGATYNPTRSAFNRTQLSVHCCPAASHSTAQHSGALACACASSSDSRASRSCISLHHKDESRKHHSNWQDVGWQCPRKHASEEGRKRGLKLLAAACHKQHEAELQPPHLTSRSCSSASALFCCSASCRSCTGCCDVTEGPCKAGGYKVLMNRTQMHSR